MITITAIICGSAVFSVLSVLTYFAKFHKTRSFDELKSAIDEVAKLARTNEDDLRKINNKMRFK